ncbi:hypothetical protein L1887_31801 [Cichorium endivia]|nr:hypothetical protein L1887_31801 [Cichorium endivia]
MCLRLTPQPSASIPSVYNSILCKSDRQTTLTTGFLFIAALDFFPSLAHSDIHNTSSLLTLSCQIGSVSRSLILLDFGANKNG